MFCFTGDYSVIRLLHIDDCENDLELIKFALESLGNKLDILQHNSFDCILCDYQMPEMDGIELLTTLRARHFNKPFIVHTGYYDEKKKDLAEEKGVDGYFHKEFSTSCYYRLLEHIITSVRKQTADW
jgi:CheY-like chemotaxis protein